MSDNEINEGLGFDHFWQIIINWSQDMPRVGQRLSIHEMRTLAERLESITKHTLIRKSAAKPIEQADNASWNIEIIRAALRRYVSPWSSDEELALNSLSGVLSYSNAELKKALDLLEKWYAWQATATRAHIDDKDYYMVAATADFIEQHGAEPIKGKL